MGVAKAPIGCNAARGFEPLPPGRYEVHVEAEGNSVKKPVNLKGGARRVVLRL